jgi:NAD(P)-dependent dehydrogenase (short-subunit alcohol dehydrogenase family)
MFAREMRRRLPAGSNIQVLAVHPGMVASDIIRSLPGPVIWLYRLVMGTILLSPRQGGRGGWDRGPCRGPGTGAAALGVRAAPPPAPLQPLLRAAAQPARPPRAPAGARATLHAASSPDAPKQARGTDGYFGSNCRPLLPGQAARQDFDCGWLWEWSSARVGLEAKYEL